ncbi:MAG: prealbumin-like fold domain-containing protein [Eggerthellaceae bacterium]
MIRLWSSTPTCPRRACKGDEGGRRDGEPVPAAGIEFDLVAASDIKTGDGVVHVPAGEIAAHIVTAADGTATAEDLYLGSYRIVETLAPDGYVLNGEPVDVTLSYAGQEVGRLRRVRVRRRAPEGHHRGPQSRRRVGAARRGARHRIPRDRRRRRGDARRHRARP